MPKRINEIPLIATRLEPTDVLVTEPDSGGLSKKTAVDLILGDSVIPVYTASDFGVESGAGYQLLAFQHYVLMDEVTLTKPLLLPADGPIEISPTAFAASSIECVGTFDIFSGSSAFGLYLHGLVVNGDGNQTIFNLVSGGSSVAFFISSDVCAFANMSSIGRIEGFNSVDMFLMSFNGFSTGLTVDDNAIFFGDTLVFNSGVTTGIPDVTIEGTSETVVFDRCRQSRTTNSIAYKIDNASAVSDGKIINCSFSDQGGSFTDPTGKDRTDPNWTLLDNGDAKDSRNIACVYLSGSETITVAASNTFYEIGGTNFLSKIAERFTVTTSGVITYSGVNPIDIKVTAVATIEKVGGGANILEARIAKNWTTAAVGEVDSAAQTQNSDPTSVAIQTCLEIENGDNIRVIMANNSGTANIIANLSNITITEA